MITKTRGKLVLDMLRAGAIMVLLLAGLSERASANPIYWVKTQATAFPGGYVALAAYNATPYFAPTGTSAVGSYFYSNPENFDNSATGTVETTGGATASWDAVTATSNANLYRNYGIPVGSLVNTAYAAANLADGSLRASGYGNSVGQQGIAQASFNDLIHYTVAGADADSVTYVALHFLLDGFVSSATGPAFARYDWEMHFGDGALFTGAADHLSTAHVLTTNSGYPMASGWDSYSFRSLDPANFAFDGVYALHGASGDISVYGALTVSAANGMSADFSHTAWYQLDLPAGVSYTSDSGVFLTGHDADPAVPEPATIGLVGLGLLATRRWRRKA